MKKHLALLLALVMVLGSFSFVSAAPDFSDVKGTNFEDAVARLELLNVLKGYPDGTFRPADTISRAEFAAVAVRVSGLEQAAMSAKGLPTGFSDVPAYHWASGYVGTAAKLGIVNGVGNGMFAPEAPVKYEEAVTMLVRALGYEPSAQAKGGYPFGYLIVANETDLLDGALGTQGTYATRGFVAKISDNALEIPMMVQIGYGSESRFEISTKDNGGVKYLFDKMGFDTFEGRVTSFNDSKNKITIKGDDNATLDVADGFDFYEVSGVTTKFWAKSDKVVAYALQDDVMFDAVAWDKKDTVSLNRADEDYDVAKDATIVLNGDKVDVKDFVADYAKIVLDEDNDIIWMEGYTLVDFMVVEKTDGNVVSAYGEELNVKDFTIVEDGKTIAVEDLEKGDVLFYNTAEEFANVYNTTVEGEITRIYTDRITVDGKDYKFADANAKYINEKGDLVKFDASNFESVVEAMEEEGPVRIFLNRKGKMVFLEGDLGDLVTSSAYVMVYKDSASYNNRGTLTWTLDVVNAAGEEVKYDIKNSSVNSTTNSMLKDKDDNRIVWTSALIDKYTVLELSIDKDGDITEVKMLEELSTIPSGGFKVSNKYYEGRKVDTSAPVFLVEDFSTDVKDIEVTTYTDIEFDFINTGTFFMDGTRVVAMVVADSDRDEEVTKHLTVATATQDKVYNKNIWRLKLVIDGAKKALDTKEDIANPNVSEGQFLEVSIDDNTGKVNAVSNIPAAQTVSGVVTNVNGSAGNFTVAGTVYKLGAKNVVVDATDSYKVVQLSNIKVGDTVDALKVSNTSVYVEVVVRTAKTGTTPPVNTTGLVTYTTGTALDVTLPEGAVVSEYAVVIGENARGIVAGKADFAGVLENGKIYTAKLVKVAELDKAIDTVTFVANITGAPVVGEETLTDVEITSLSTTAVKVAGETTTFRFNDDTEYDEDGSVTIGALAGGTAVVVREYITLVVKGNQVVSLTYDSTNSAALKAAALVETAKSNLAQAIADANTLLAAKKSVVAGVSADDKTVLGAAFTNLETAVKDTDAFKLAIVAAEAFDVTGKTAAQIDTARTTLLGAQGTFEGVVTAFDTAVTTLETARTNLNTAIADANTLAHAQQTRLDSFTVSEIAAINSTHANGYNTYAAGLVTFKGAINTAEAFDVTGKTATQIDTARTTLTTAQTTFAGLKTTFDGLATVVTIGK